MKSIVLLFAVFCLITVPAAAQNQMEDVVYLKTGGIIRGVIVEQVPAQYVKIRTKDQNVFVFKPEEIEKMTRENLISSDNTGNFQMPKEGFGGFAEVGLALGFGSYRKKLVDNAGQNMGTVTVSGGISLGFKVIGGYRFSENIFGGLGLGLDYFPMQSDLSQDISIRFVPLTLDLRTNITKTKRSPIVNLAVGYAIGLDDVNGGLIIHPQLGYQSYLSPRVAWNFSFGYKWQGREQLFYNYFYSSAQTIKLRENILFGFLTLNTGFSF